MLPLSGSNFTASAGNYQAVAALTFPVGDDLIRSRGSADGVQAVPGSFHRLQLGLNCLQMQHARQLCNHWCCALRGLRGSPVMARNSAILDDKVMEK